MFLLLLFLIFPIIIFFKTNSIETNCRKLLCYKIHTTYTTIFFLLYLTELYNWFNYFFSPSPLTHLPLFFWMPSYNDIFERSVQDPCSDACDCEDSLISSSASFPPPTTDHTVYKNTSHKTLPHNILPNYLSNNNDNNTGKIKEKHSDNIELDMTKHELRKIHTTPLHNMVSVPQRPQLGNRANSCAFIHQLSRTNSNVSTNPLPCTTRPEAPFLKRASSTNCLPNSRNNNNNTVVARNYCCAMDLHCSPLKRESSSLAIPTHIYGLEKYVSSELDELSSSNIDSKIQSTSNSSSNNYSNSGTNHYFVSEKKGTFTKINTSKSISQNLETSSALFSSPLSSSTSISSTASSTTSLDDTISSNKKKVTTTSHLKKWKNAALKKTQGLKPARKSFIKVALANSFA